MIEYSVPALLALSFQIMQLCETQQLRSDQIEQLRVRLSDPNPDGSIEIQVGFPRSMGFHGWRDLKQ